MQPDRLKLVSDVCALPRQRPWVLMCAAEPPCQRARGGSSLRAPQHKMDVPVPCGGSWIVFLQGCAQGITPCFMAVGKKPHSVATERVILPLCHRFFCWGPQPFVRSRVENEAAVVQTEWDVGLLSFLWKTSDSQGHVRAQSHLSEIPKCPEYLLYLALAKQCNGCSVATFLYYGPLLLWQQGGQLQKTQQQSFVGHPQHWTPRSLHLSPHFFPC